jgi:hypothetical protein
MLNIENENGELILTFVLMGQTNQGIYKCVYINELHND